MYAAGWSLRRAGGATQAGAYAERGVATQAGACAERGVATQAGACAERGGGDAGWSLRRAGYFRPAELQIRPDEVNSAATENNPVRGCISIEKRAHLRPAEFAIRQSRI
jgi:hypothetical protein